jgi:hypothetical protein
VIGGATGATPLRTGLVVDGSTVVGSAVVRGSSAASSACEAAVFEAAFVGVAEVTDESEKLVVSANFGTTTCGRGGCAVSVSDSSSLSGMRSVAAVSSDGLSGDPTKPLSLRVSVPAESVAPFWVSDTGTDVGFGEESGEACALLDVNETGVCSEVGVGSTPSVEGSAESGDAGSRVKRTDREPSGDSERPSAADSSEVSTDVSRSHVCVCVGVDAVLNAELLWLGVDGYTGANWFRNDDGRGGVGPRSVLSCERKVNASVRSHHSPERRGEGGWRESGRANRNVVATSTIVPVCQWCTRTAGSNLTSSQQSDTSTVRSRANPFATAVGVGVSRTGSK